MVQGLSLARNHVRRVPDRWAERLHSLTYLRLDENKLEELGPLAFIGLESTLRSLSVARNKLTEVPVSALRLLAFLETLNLSRNKILNVSADSFNSSAYLQVMRFTLAAVVDEKS